MADRSPTSSKRSAGSAGVSNWITQYRNQQKAALDSIPADAVCRLVDRLRAAYAEDRQIFVFGNGGIHAAVIEDDRKVLGHAGQSAQWSVVGSQWSLVHNYRACRSFPRRGLSRGAAAECSPGREPGERETKGHKPRRGGRSFLRPYGAASAL